MGAVQVPGDVVRLGGEKEPYYESDNTTASYVESTFGFTSYRILVVNDSDNSIDMSFDGSTLHGTILGGGMHEFAGSHTSIFVKSAAGSDAFRIWAW